MKHSTGKPTKAEQDRLDAIHDMECIACEMERGFAKNRGELWPGQPFRTEAHHLVDRGYRKHSGGHASTLPLEAWHHRGRVLDGLTGREMKELYGPSLALHKREFVAQYGSERTLLAEIDRRLAKRNAA